MIIDKSVNKIVITPNESKDWWSIEIHEDDLTSHEGGSESIKETAWDLVFKCYSKSWKHQPERMHKIDKDRINQMRETFMTGMKRHMEYVFENIYKPSKDNKGVKL